MGSSNITPCPLNQAITCHLLQYLIDKVQKKAFIHLFPSHYDKSLYQQNLAQYGNSIANRGRDEHRNKYLDRFEVLNKAIASTLTFLLLKPLKWNALNKLVVIHYLFTVRVFAMQTALEMLVFALQKIHQSIKHLQQTILIFFKPNLIPKPNDLAQKNGKRIKELLAELEKNFPNELKNLEQSTDFPMDSITYKLPIYPVKEKNNPLHFWDIETLKIFFEKSSTSHCPNGCGKKLELEDAVATDAQDEIINLLKRELERLKNN
ncbi:hypothetical protein [Candidatus Rhabdochlamydia sp. T3358]|uniref:hypothetical protein n=1 Tax=Candidatus Rhabdochlamydia sp. T3358 TaxID=2099795 RepID=UPI0010FEC946|nr:hypothetical protein [Candidatus Rhabdochlamydia sp. T3358]